MKKIKKIIPEQDSRIIEEIFDQCYYEYLNSNYTLEECVINHYALQLILDKELDFYSNTSDFVFLLSEMCEVLKYEPDMNVYREKEQQKPKLRLVK